jgi:CHASE1-domain containing sensor protein
MDDEDYQASLFGTYAETKEEAKQTIAEGDEANALGDKLTLATVIMAVSLFLLGIAAVVSSVRMKLIMGGVGVVIFVVAGIITATVPVLTL